MQDKSKVIFGNELSKKDYKKACATKKKFIKKYGDDGNENYTFALEECPVLSPMGVKKLVLGEGVTLPENSVFIGNIRMGFGHYRISMAMASCAHAMGYTPIWLDLNSFPTSTCTKIISSQNDLYSLGSRLSQKSKLFNKLVWEPLNSEGFRKLSYNAADQKSAELMANLLKGLDKSIPFVATHAWPAQAANHAGFSRVVNAIPDNWPMALHLSEGSIHTVQTESSFLGYKALRGMDKKRSLSPMPQGSLVYTGHYVDDELVKNLPADTQKRLNRIQNKKAKRYLLTVGGAGAQQQLFEAVINKLLPDVESGKAVLFLNVGDHKNVLDGLKAKIPALQKAKEFIDDYASASAFAQSAIDEEISGIYSFSDQDIFAAVYLTNLLMRASDVLVTKPSELSFYPIPKLFIRRVGGHEAWGAIRSQEVGDGSYECAEMKDLSEVLSLMQTDSEVLTLMNERILKNNQAGLYNGAYEVIRLATQK